MKFFTSTLLIAIAATSAAAQRALIGVPKNGTDVPANQPLTVEIDRPNFQSSAVEVAIVIGIASCTTTASGCLAPAAGGIGTIIYNGTFNPELKPGFVVPHENFTLQIPSNIPKGSAQLSLTQFSLIGASLTPSTLFDTVSVNVV